MTNSLPLGKTPATYDSRDIKFADVRPTTLNIPIPKPGGGYGMDFGATGWSMLGNGPDDTVFPGFTGAGDCVWAGAAHETMESHKNAKSAVPAFSGKTVIDQYSAYSGYNPQTGANDNGSDVRTVLNWRQNKGLLDDSGTTHKIGAYVALEPGNLQMLWEALYLFEAVGIGVKFPNSAQNQFSANQTWSVVPGATIEGGHYFPLVGHPTNNIWTCVSWGRRQLLTPQFITTYCDEAYCWVDPERYNAVTGLTHEHYKDADLERYITAVATP